MKKGFTLVELLVSISIFMIITIMAVVNHSQFNSTILLTNLAYEIGLSIRQAQVYGITVKQTSASPIQFNSGYGIHFDLQTDPKTYVLFEDVKPSGSQADHVYSQGTDDDVETFHIQKGNSISGIYIDGVTTSQPVVDISFIRPNPDAYIIVSGDVNRHSKAEICLKSPQGTKRKVVVESTGQISVVSSNLSICTQ